MKTFAEWFDPHNIDHIKAYRQLQETGQWPKDFKPDNIKIGHLWTVELAHKMANAWVMYMLENEE